MNYALVFLNRAKFLLNQNSSTLLTGVGVVGSVGTAVLTGRASFKASTIINEDVEKTVREENERRETTDQPYIALDEVRLSMSTFEKVRLVWPLYIPPVAAGVLTVSSIIVAHRIDAKKIVALTLASGVSERALKEYKEKVIEKLGERQDTKIRDEIAQDRVEKFPPKNNEILLVGDGKVLCMDMLTGRYFMSTAETLKRAENRINNILNQQMYASLTELYEELGLESTAYSDTVGWNSNRQIELQISAAMTHDERPCLAVEPNPHPFAEYSRLHD